MNKAVSRYNQTQHRTLSPTKMVAALFFKCSKILDTVAENIKNKDYYARYENSEKVIMALTNLATAFDEKNPEVQGFVKEIKEFCMLVLNYVTEINHKENLQLCNNTSKLLHEMGEVWQKVE